MPEEKQIKMYTSREVAEILQVDTLTVNRYLREGKIRGFKLGNRWRISKEALIEISKLKKKEVNRHEQTGID